MGLEFDSVFIQPEEHQPNKSASVSGTDSIPLIDLLPVFQVNAPAAGDHVEKNLVSQIGEACQYWGFFQIINHGVPSELRRRIEIASSEFFGMPIEEKRKVRRDEANPYGYYDTEHTKNVRDWKEVFDFAVKEPAVMPASPDREDGELVSFMNQWPEKPLGFRKACEDYGAAVEKLAYKLLGLISMSLGLPKTELHSYFDDHLSRLRLNHYPVCPSPDLALGVGRHKDGAALAILAQDEVGGLQVKRKSDGEWINVVPLADSFIVNVGDVFQVWSNDRYESVEHRVVVNSKNERFSIPFFFLPSHHVMVKPLEKLVGEANPPRYRVYNYGKFYAARRLSNFKKLDVENVQIYHFRI